LVEGEVRAGSVKEPDAVVEGDPDGFFHLFVNGRFDGVSVDGDRTALERLVNAVVVLREPDPVPA
ncbi:MAG: hypothetical protein ACRDN6_04425, partial [Gaiellaceae bacterium]